MIEMGNFQSASKEYFEHRYRNHDDRWTKREESAEVTNALEGLILKVAEQRNKVTLLDIGCGLMPVTLPLTEKFSNLYIIGIDWAINDVLKAYPDFESQVGVTGRVSIIGADFFLFAYIPRFDVAVDLGVFHHISPSDWKKYVISLSGLLRDDGHFFLESFHPDDNNWAYKEPGGHLRKGYYCHYHNISSLQAVFGKEFDHIAEVTRCGHWEHVVAFYHITKAGKPRCTEYSTL